MTSLIGIASLTMPSKDGHFHVVPINDLKDHMLTADCWCMPERDDEYPEVFVHNSADGREHTYEKGKLQ